MRPPLLHWPLRPAQDGSRPCVDCALCGTTLVTVSELFTPGTIRAKVRKHRRECKGAAS